MPCPTDTDVRLFEQLRPRLTAISRRIVGSEAEAEDVVQDCFLKWHGAERASLATPAAWLTTVVQHQSIDRLRRRARDEVAAHAAMQLIPAAPVALPEDGLLRDAELAGALARLLACLTPAERLALVLREAFDCEHADIAAALGTTAIKQANVAGRLTELIALQPQETAALSIVGVAANPFDMGTAHWLANLEQFKSLSHIASLQAATTQKIAANGGALAIVQETKNSVIRDVLSKQLPVAIANDERIAVEVDKLESMSTRLRKQLVGAKSQITDVRGSLRGFVVDYFADLILQAKGVNMDTFSDFFEREVGSEGIMVSTRLQNEFERQLKSVTQEISNMKIGFDAEINHFNSTIKQFGKQGLDYLVKSKVINNTTVLATRDGVVTAAKYIGLDLGKMLKFKPWGATNLAKGVNGALAVVGLALEAWDSWEQAERRKEFQKAMAKMIENFELQRQELVALIDGEKFTEQFFASYIELQRDVAEVQKDVDAQREQRSRFRAWRERGEAIDVEFAEVVS